MKTERKKRDKKHLKGRILRSISLILICENRGLKKKKTV